MKQTLKNRKTMHWKCNTPALLKEICTNPGVVGSPASALGLFATILGELAEYALELNDPKLNAIMCRLCLYEQSDPYSKEYDKKLTEQTIKAFYP